MGRANWAHDQTGANLSIGAAQPLRPIQHSLWTPHHTAPHPHQPVFPLPVAQVAVSAPAPGNHLRRGGTWSADILENKHK